MPLPTRRQVAVGLALASGLAGPARALTGAVDAPTPPSTWDLTPLYPSDAAWDSACERMETTIAELASQALGLGAGGTVGLTATLIARSDVRRAVLRLGVYAQLKADANLESAPDQDRRARSEALAGKLEEASVALDVAVRALGRAAVSAAVDGRPELARFRYGLERLFRAGAHAPPTAAAAVLAAAHPLLASPEDIYRQIIAAAPTPDVRLTDGRSIALTGAAYSAVLNGQVRADRAAARAARAASLRPFAPALAATVTAYARGRALQARTARHDGVEAAVLAEAGIPPTVLRTAIAQARESLPLLRRYVELRRRKLGVDRLSLSDFSVPLTRARPQFNLPQMRELTLRAVAPLGPDYGRRLGAATLARWMDALPRPGKAAAGYCDYDAYDVHPYIFFNLGEDYQSLSEFAHEWGHAMHAALAAEAQPFDLALPATFTTEIAATCHEQLLVRDLIARATDDDERTYYLWRKALFQVGFFFQTLMKTELEQAIHEKIWAGGGVTSDDLNAMWLKLLRAYWGDGVAIDEDDGLGWTQNPQLFDAFYNFQYATSITGAVHFATALRTGDAGERARYLSLLQAGGSDDAYVLLRKHGLDLADPAPYRTFAADFASTLQALEPV